MKNLATIILINLIAFSTLTAGGPWTQKKGNAYIKLSEWWTVFDKHYTDSGLLDPNVTTGVFNTSLFVEYGISDRFTTTFNGPVFSRNLMNNLRSRTTNEIVVPGEALNSLGDIDLGLKYSLTKPESQIPVALSLILGLPTGTISGGSQGNLQTGDGEFNQLIQIDAGKGFSLGKQSLYLAAYSGINNRTNEYSEEIRYGLEIGLGIFNQKLWLQTKLNAVESFKNGSTAETITSTSLFANNSEFTSISFEASYYFTKRIGLSAGIATAIKGEIIAAAPSYTVGVFYDLKK